MMAFIDREDAGRQLAQHLVARDLRDPVVLGLPRGGVPVAYEVARVLSAPLDVILVRKLGAPGQPELALGAVGENGVRLVNRPLVRTLGVSDEMLADIEARERATLERQARQFRGDRPDEPLSGRTAVVVDDGVATGATARTACAVAAGRNPAGVVLAVPVAARRVLAELRRSLDVVCVQAPVNLQAVGPWYEDFGQITDEEVVRLLERRARDRSA
jgi:putative phosphoribosyl transferase